MHRFIKISRCLSTIKKEVKAERLIERSLIRISSKETVQYLQGLITNDMEHLEQNNSLYAMFLNQKGRVLYDTIIYKTSNPEVYLIEADKSIVQELRNHLLLYKVRRKLQIDIVDDEFSVWNTNTENLKIPNIIISRDPRVSSLGYRLIVTKEQNIEEYKIPYYKKLRYELGIGEGVTDLPPGNCFPLECNCDYMHGVSFHKGCYIGQELTARTHHTGTIRKRLMPVMLTKEVLKIQNPDIFSKNLGKSCGKMRGVNGQMGLGLLRCEEALQTNDLLFDDITVTTKIPEWWPKEAPKKRVPSQN